MVNIGKSLMGTSFTEPTFEVIGKKYREIYYLSNS